MTLPNLQSLLAEAETSDEAAEYVEELAQVLAQALKGRLHQLETERKRLHTLLQDAYPYVESALMASANQGFHESAQKFLDRYRKEIGK